MSLLRYSKYGIYCAVGDFYIDATGRVERNIVTHAHSDHARPGHKSYLCHQQSLPLLKSRLGKKSVIEGLEYNQMISINGVKVSLHPAGHVFGSAQIRVEHDGQISVVTGDYKLEDDNLSTPFEPVICDTFFTECTFGLPVYRWPDQYQVYNEIDEWWRNNKQKNITSLLFGYSLGKSQRIFKNIDHGIGKVFVHKTVAAMNNAIVSAGGELPETILINEKTNIEEMKGNLIIAPPSITSGSLLHGIGPISTAMASGWVQTGKNFGRGNVNRGFILSDHVDWDALMRAIEMTGAENVITMHGYTSEVTRYLNEKGIKSMEIDELKYQPYQL